MSVTKMVSTSEHLPRNTSGCAPSINQTGASVESVDTENRETQLRVHRSSQEQSSHQRLDRDKQEDRPICRRNSMPSSDQGRQKSELAHAMPPSSEGKICKEVGSLDDRKTCNLWEPFNAIHCQSVSHAAIHRCFKILNTSICALEPDSQAIWAAGERRRAQSSVAVS